MKKIYIALFFITNCYLLSAQNEASFWYFGQRAGVQFNAVDGRVTAITDGQLNTLEGCTTISDTNGNLLFYSDGITVWNRNHQVMLNGTGLKGDPSSTSSGLIVPRPQDPDFYYIFTVDEPHHFNSASFPNETDGDGINDGLTYSRININDNGGLGAVEPTEKNVPLITYDTTNPLHVDYRCSEKITAVRADDCSSFWVITHFADSFYAFKIDENGVSTTPVISTVGPNVPPQGYRRNALGYLKASPDGSKLAVAHFGLSTVTAQDAGGGVYLFDFDNDTGTVSNSEELYSPQNNDSPYGVEFSSENRKVYATIGLGIGGNGASQILQWDLEQIDIPNSLEVISTSNTLSAGALQLGIDRRIYRAQVNFQNFNSTGRYLGVINNPEADGTAVGYDEQGLLIDPSGTGQNLSRIGLPPFIQSLFNTQIDIIQNEVSTTELNLCAGESFTLTAENIVGADYAWSKDGNPLPETSFELVVDTPGFYEVFIEPNTGECPIEGNAVVGVFDIPVANTVTNINICDDNNDDISTFDFVSETNQVLASQDSNQFSVKYYETLLDANDGINEITFPYDNRNNPQQIFVRVDNNDNINCFDITDFTITVFNTPTINNVVPQAVCDTEGDVLDGIVTTDLSQFNETLLGPLQNLTTTISYHINQQDADSGNNPLPINFSNTTAFSQDIFVRLENDANSTCFSTASFTLTVNPLPEVNNTSIFQCDEDGVPDGITAFNINEVFDDIIGGSSDRTVDYYLSATDAISETNPINANNYINISNPQIIHTRVTNTITGCVNFGEVSLEVSATASNDATITVCDDDGTEDGFFEFNLSDADAEVTAGLQAGLDVVYYQNFNDALLENNPLSNAYINTTPFNETIFVRVENANACFGINQVELVVNELPNIETEFETLYCLNTFPETITLTGGVINDNPNDFFYEWSTGETTSEIQINVPGIYTVRVINTLGCFKERTINVLASNVATITNIEVRDASQNNTIVISVTGEGDYEYALDFINGIYQDSNRFENVSPGLHTVFVRDKNNCGITEEIVSVIGFPKFFTPNGDGNNDFWQVQGVSSQFQPNSIIYIFDRYGKLLKELSPRDSGWDGIYNGNLMPTNDYWFSVTLEDGRQFSSHFTLKR
ncbi:T9SS type B sorting domain-containing protein [Winogradskyella immobilis]|uniref:T9SS type B sorting domain-containing protein n=1 Tax=Winogradskyella immobilis TaxID=2816852 RepID=A0ABS8EPW9_9FLAO|nr:T9SS type B sorting domain-containing protein [Winogradskyella immobilis]MCC1485260.1 T9SS type B sorting domain-containing protein [Winogradskyella immobilis]MCG0017352.1 T9SS type B sorting domain-containing protein [Winogradskyella immobilis]